MSTVLKYSRQREAIRTFLCSRKDHPTAEVVYDNLRKDFPHISRIADNGHLAVDPERIYRLRPCDRKVDYRKSDQEKNERIKPVFVKTRQETVNEYSRCNGIRNAEQIADRSRKHYENDRSTCTRKPFSSKAQSALTLAAWFEVL